MFFMAGLLAEPARRTQGPASGVGSHHSEHGSNDPERVAPDAVVAHTLADRWIVDLDGHANHRHAAPRRPEEDLGLEVEMIARRPQRERGTHRIDTKPRLGIGKRPAG